MFWSKLIFIIALSLIQYNLLIYRIKNFLHSSTELNLEYGYEHVSL